METSFINCLHSSKRKGVRPHNGVSLSHKRDGSTYATTRVNLENIALSERSQTPKAMCCDSTYTECPQLASPGREQIRGCQDGREGSGGDWGDGMFWNETGMMAVQHCACARNHSIMCFKRLMLCSVNCTSISLSLKGTITRFVSFFPKPLIFSSRFS